MLSDSCSETQWQPLICATSEDGGNQPWLFDSTAGPLVVGEECAMNAAVRVWPVFVVRKQGCLVEIHKGAELTSQPSKQEVGSRQIFPEWSVGRRGRRDTVHFPPSDLFFLTWKSHSWKALNSVTDVKGNSKGHLCPVEAWRARWV